MALRAHRRRRALDRRPAPRACRPAAIRQISACSRYAAALSIGSASACPRLPSASASSWPRPRRAQQAGVLGDGGDVRRIQRKRARRRRQRLVDPAEPERVDARRLDGQRAGAGRVRLGGRLLQQHRRQRLQLSAPVVRARQPRQRRARAGIERQRRLVGAHRLVVGRGALFVDHRRAVAPGEADVGGSSGISVPELERRLRGDQGVARLLGGAQQRAQRRRPPLAQLGPLAVQRQRLARILQALLVQRAHALEPRRRLARGVARRARRRRRRALAGPGRGRAPPPRP